MKLKPKDHTQHEEIKSAISGQEVFNEDGRKILLCDSYGGTCGTQTVVLIGQQIRILLLSQTQKISVWTRLTPRASYHKCNVTGLRK